jgi:hypothetical protein
VLKLEISDRVTISWRILASSRGFFEDYIFAWWNIWVSLILLLPVILFNVNGSAVVYHTPRWEEGILPRVWHTPFMLEKFYEFVKTSAQIFSVCTHTYKSQTTCGEISENAFRFLKCPMPFLHRVVTPEAMGRKESDPPHIGPCCSNAHSLGHCPALLVITRIKFGWASCTLSQNQLQKLTVNWVPPTIQFLQLATTKRVCPSLPDTFAELLLSDHALGLGSDEFQPLIRAALDL